MTNDHIALLNHCVFMSLRSWIVEGSFYDKRESIGFVRCEI